MRTLANLTVRVKNERVIFSGVSHEIIRGGWSVRRFYNRRPAVSFRVYTTNLNSVVPVKLLGKALLASN